MYRKDHRSDHRMLADRVDDNAQLWWIYDVQSTDVCTLRGSTCFSLITNLTFVVGILYNRNIISLNY